MNAFSTKPATRVGAVALVAALAACSGGGTSGIVPSSGKHTQSAAIAFTMHWPSAQSVAAARRAGPVRRPSFISPQTQSVVVEVNNDSSLTTTANKPAQGNVSTVSVNAPVGSDSITITTWDQANGSGNLLGQITVTQTVVAGQTNTVNATVDGVMEKVGISGAPSPFLETTTDQTGAPKFALVGTVAQTFTIVPEDVDGDVIVPPGDAPTLTLSSTNTAISVKPVSGKNDEYTVQAVNVMQPGSNAALKVDGVDGLGNTISSQFALSESSAIYVGYAGPNGTSVVVYDMNGKPLTTTGSFAGIADASAMTYDYNHNRLLIADAGIGTVAAFDAQGNPDSTFTQSAVTGANGLVYDEENDQLYVTQGSQGKVAAFTGAGAPVTLAGTPFTGMTTPSSITYDPNVYGYLPNPQLYVADANFGATMQVPAFNLDGTAAAQGSGQYSGTDQFTSTAVAYDSIVNYIFVVGWENAGNGPYPILREFDPDWGGFPQVTATDGLNQPYGIAFNPINYEIYVTNNGDGTISAYKDFAITTTFTRDTSVTFTPPNGQTQPKGIAIVF